MNPFVVQYYCQEQVKQAVIGAAIGLGARTLARGLGSAAKGVGSAGLSAGKAVARNPGRTAKGGLGALGIGWPLASAANRSPTNPIRPKYLGHRPDPPKVPKL